MKEAVIDLLFWPWFQFIQFDDSPHVLRISIAASWVFLAIFLLTRLFIHNKEVTRKIVDIDSWPIFLQRAYRVFCGAVEVNFLGFVANSLVLHYNSNKMPVYESSGELGSWPVEHVFVNENTKLVWLSDYIKLSGSRFFEFLFPPRITSDGIFIRTHCGPGDLANAFGTIIAWWVAIVIVGWSIWYVIHRKNQARACINK